MGNSGEVADLRQRRTKILWLANSCRCWALTRGSMPISKSLFSILPALTSDSRNIDLTDPHSLQYQNRKAEYFSAIWDVINWKTAEKRFQ